MQDNKIHTGKLVLFLNFAVLNMNLTESKNLTVICAWAMP